MHKIVSVGRVMMHGMRMYVRSECMGVFANVTAASVARRLSLTSINQCTKVRLF